MRGVTLARTASHTRTHRFSVLARILNLLPCLHKRRVDGVYLWRRTRQQQDTHVQFVQPCHTIQRRVPPLRCSSAVEPHWCPLARQLPLAVRACSACMQASKWCYRQSQQVAHLGYVVSILAAACKPPPGRRVCCCGCRARATAGAALPKRLGERPTTGGAAPAELGCAEQGGEHALAGTAQHRVDGSCEGCGVWRVRGRVGGRVARG